MKPHPSEISRLLAERILDLARVLAGERPVAHTRGAIRIGSRGSLAIETRPPTMGVWFDHEAGTGGDALSLVRHFRGGSTKDALAWSTAWLGGALQHSDRRPATPSKRARTPAGSDLWRTVWNDARSGLGTPVERYLRSRGLRWPEEAPLRFHPACPRGPERFPAMLALMTDALTGAPCGGHRTYLLPDGAGKALVTPAKMMLGVAGVVRLVPDELIGLGLGLAEGIETGLAILQHAEWSPVWAACSAGAIARFPVLPGIESLTIFADADDKGAGLLAAWRCAEQWSAAGREVTIQRPPAGTDWHDALGGQT